MIRTLRISHFIIYLLFLSIITYFVYHAINGERGIVRMFQLSKQINKLQIELEQIRSERLQLEHKTNLMRSDSLDLDLLEEQVRKTLGYASNSENVYFFESK